MKGTRSSCVFCLAVAVFALEIMKTSKVEAFLQSSSWWSLGLFGCDVDQERAECRNCAAMEYHNITTHEQEPLCRSNHEEIRSISKGSRHAILDCQRRFNDSRWNCATFDSSHIFGEFVERCTRETALLYSYFIAGATWALATDCRSMRLRDCVCRRSNDESNDESNEDGTVVFYECNANVEYARRFLDEFVLNEQRKSNESCQRLSYRNSIYGYNAMRTTHTSCRCHGISGTCTAQTCSEVVRSVEEVGEELVERFEKAVQTNGTEEINTNFNESAITYLQYENPSPDFCKKNETAGTLGVQGRLCEPNHPTHNCTTLCCGRGFETKLNETEIEECEFEWCCRIVCRITGTQFVPITRCK